MKRLLIALVLLVVLGGCMLNQPTRPAEPPIDMAEADLVGAWQNDRRGSTIQFESDGTFTATDLPYQVFVGFSDALPPGFDRAHDRLSGSGKWMLTGPIGDLEGRRRRIGLLFAIIANREAHVGQEMRAEREGQEVVISFYVGDPDLDNRVVYKKCHESCPRVTPTGS